MLSTKICLNALFSSWFKSLEPDFFRNHRLIENKQQLLLQNINFLNVISKAVGYEHKTTHFFDFSSQNIVIGKEDLKVKQQLNPLVSALIPWRKGPFNLFGTIIQSEWDCSFKWRRIMSLAKDLFYQKEVIDLGCQNPYFLCKIFQEQANFILGLDPHFLGYLQSAFLLNLIKEPLSIYHLPINHLDWLAISKKRVDTLVCMGVLTHQRDPKVFLNEIRQMLRPGGKLLIETLVIPKGDSLYLQKEERYAGMKNIYFLPNMKDLQAILKECSYQNIHTVDISATSLQEQKSSSFSSPVSLLNFLDSKDHSKTVEGYPRPHRAILVAECPS